MKDVFKIAPLGALLLLWLPFVQPNAKLAGQAQTCGTESVSSPSYNSFFGRQVSLKAKSPEWQVQLVKWQPSKWPPEKFTFEVTNAKGGAVSRLSLPAWNSTSALQVDQIDEITVIPGQNRFLVLGRPGASSSEADLIGLPSGEILDRFPCFMPVVSPDRRFLAFVKPFPGHPGPVAVTAEYLVYDLTQSPSYNRPHFIPGVTYDAGWPVYPPGTTNAVGSNLVPGLNSPVHWLSSRGLFWLDARRLTFTDRYNYQDRFVVVDMSYGIHSPLVRTEVLNAGDLLDLQKCKTNYSADDYARMLRDPSGLIDVQQISLAPKWPGHVCLRFQPSPCLTQPELALKVR